MNDEFNPSRPIYLQLIDRINRQIVRQELHAGDKLPSVRDFAIQSGVNHNTVQRAYAELERMGIVQTRRGQGTFITENESVLIELREKLKEEKISTFVKEMCAMGYTVEEMITGLKQYLQLKGEGQHDSV